MLEPSTFRSRFPVCEQVAYLNAGSCGPLPAEAVIAARAALSDAVHLGRGYAHFQARLDMAQLLREGYARVLNRPATEVALTSSTSEGLGKVLAGIDLGPQDVILTSDEEHPGLIGPLVAATRRGAKVRTAPLATITDAVDDDVTIVACSHVGWVRGGEVDPRIAELDIPVILDGAQGVGAVPVDVEALGCVAYAGAGQKWLCGADGTGMLWIDPDFVERVYPATPGYTAFADMATQTLHADARAHDISTSSREGVALSLTSLQVLESFGIADIQERALTLAEQCAQALADAGRTLAARGRTTLVSWEDPTPEETARRCAGSGVLIRFLPGTPYLRASVGAWNTEGDLERLLASLT